MIDGRSVLATSDPRGRFPLDDSRSHIYGHWTPKLHDTNTRPRHLDHETSSADYVQSLRHSFVNHLDGRIKSSSAGRPRLSSARCLTSEVPSDGGECTLSMARPPGAVGVTVRQRMYGV